jgi:hypothetical protein
MAGITFHRGAWLMDTQRERVGQYMDYVGGRVQLRPVGGGKEWEVSPGVLRRPTAEELRRAGVLRTNSRKNKGRCRA